MKLIIIRHGEPDYAIDSLTEKGWREARLLANRLGEMKIDGLYTSPLGRAQATAMPTEEIVKQKAIILPWLREFSGKIISPYSGKKRIPWDIAPGVWGNEMSFYGRTEWSNTSLIQTGDSAKVYEEMTKGVDSLLAQYGLQRQHMIYRPETQEDSVIVLFCHCCMGLSIISYLTGISPFVMWHNFFLPTSSISMLVTETDQQGYAHFRCVQLGDTSHLYAGGEPVSESGLYPKFEY